MLRSRIVPSLLLRDGGLVKTRRFADDKYVGDPINAVKIFNEKEVDELAIFDIDASAGGREPDYDLLKRIAVESRMPLCYGGGVSNAAQASRLLQLGFEKISINTAAIARPELVRELADAIGTQSVAVTVDVRKAGLLGRQTIHTENGRKASKLRLVDYLQDVERLGAGEIIVNSVDRDGMMQGYDIDLARTVRATVSIPMMMLGGAGSASDMRELIDAVGVVGAAAGSMFVFTGSYRAVLISYARP